jgi:hypothetical protein
MKSAIKKVEKLILPSTSPISNNPNILKYLVDNQLLSYRENKKNLSRNMIEELTIVFGKHNKCLRLVFMTKIWILEYKGFNFFVYTAKNKGTTIELQENYDDIRNGKHEDIIIEFLDQLYTLIN